MVYEETPVKCRKQREKRKDGDSRNALGSLLFFKN